MLPLVQRGGMALFPPDL